MESWIYPATQVNVETNMKRFLSLLAASAILVSLAAPAVAQDAKDKAATSPEKDKAGPSSDKDKTAPASDKDKKETPPAKAVTEISSDQSYYPLQIGNTWYYRLGDNKYSLKVAKFEKIGELNCARIEMSVEEKVTAFEHIAVTPEGVVRAAYDERKAEPPLLFLKLPPKKDATWKVDSVIGKTDKSPGERVTGTFKEGEASKVTVPFGVYDNVITCSSQDLDANGVKLNFTYYFAKGVGMIKQEIDVGGQKVIIELEKFEHGRP
jgi:hypothetical protein